MFRSAPLAFVIATLALAPAICAQVVVKQNPADVKTRTFDPKHPSRDMPKLAPNEAAVTDSRFSCGVQIEVEIASPDNGKATIKVVGVNVDLKADVVMWLPTNVNAKIRAHEAGHRDITLDFYKGADEIAKKVAAKYLGKEVDVDGVEKKDTQPVIQRLANEFCGDYLGQTEVRAETVQKRYDELTDHGRNRVPEKDAIKEAKTETADGRG